MNHHLPHSPSSTVVVSITTEGEWITQTAFQLSSTVQRNTALPFTLSYPNGCSATLKGKIDQWLSSYLKKEEMQPALPLLYPKCTPFQLAVWEKIKKIPFCAFETYSSIAQQIGSPQAHRAVGTACGKNIFPLFIPCHRVLGKGKQLGGFAFSPSIKKELLDFEGVAYLMH